ncbi:MAG: PASTA domain-containing protein [Candidatus Latescibacteria bacterium]|nr:PASTA domain-containing protein [Candidatus Latescibacterota bacterium]
MKREAGVEERFGKQDRPGREVRRVERAHMMRLKLVVVGAFLFGLVLAGRLFSVQLVNRGKYESNRPAARRVALEARRGEIFDAEGTRLATNLSAYSYYVSAPSEVRRPAEVAERFARIGGEPRSEILSRLSRGCSFTWLLRKADDRTDQEIRKWNLKGVHTLMETTRHYPFGALAGQVLGYTNVDNKGIEGLELGLDEDLHGKPGWMAFRVDARGRRFAEINNPVQDPRDGDRVLLTLSAPIQEIVEEELSDAVARFSARSGQAVLMDPRTGAILAMANAPSCDPNHPGKTAVWTRKNRTITDCYEPGSIFKIVAVTAALEEGIKRPEDRIFCENGKFKVAGRTIRDAHKYGWLTLQEVLEYSSNIGTIKVAQELGPRLLYQYGRAFGFGYQTGINLPGEVKGTFRPPAKWSGLSLATIAMGQEVSVTALQMATAYGAIANGGVLMRPWIVRAVKDAHGKTVRESKPQAIRRVMSPETARTLTEFLLGAVERGTGVNAQLEGVHVAGKTGTAQKAIEGGRGYAPGQYVSSFVGFLPAEDPKIVCLVSVDTPRGVYYGSQVAAPAFKRIMDRVLSLKDCSVSAELRAALESEAVVRGERVIVPNVCGLPVPQAIETLCANRLAGSSNSVRGKVRKAKEAVVSGQWPVAGAKAVVGTKVWLASAPSEAFALEGASAKLPNVVGMSFREALRRLSALGVQVNIRGNGRVKRQRPRAGARVREGMVCVLEGA